MRKTKKTLILLFSVLILFAIAHSFIQSVRLPLDAVSAEKVLTAWNIPRGKTSIRSWTFSVTELPVYMICTAILGPSAFAGIFAALIFWLVPFCAGLWILFRRGLLNPVTALIWLALTGLPDTEWLSAIRNAPGVTLWMLILSFAVIRLFENHGKIRPWITAFVSAILLTDGILTALPAANLKENLAAALQAFQVTYRANFYLELIQKLSTGRYFLMTLALIITFAVLALTIIRMCRGEKTPITEKVLSAGLLLTFLFCCLPVSGTLMEKAAFCSWAPFGGAALLGSFYVHSHIGEERMVQYRVRLSAVITVFFLAGFLFCIGPITIGRQPTDADRAAIFLMEQGLERGSCPDEDLALLTVAAKGRIDFSLDPEDPEAQFVVYREADAPEGVPGIEEVGIYKIKSAVGS